MYAEHAGAQHAHTAAGAAGAAQAADDRASHRSFAAGAQVDGGGARVDVAAGEGGRDGSRAAEGPADAKAARQGLGGVVGDGGKGLVAVEGGDAATEDREHASLHGGERVPPPPRQAEPHQRVVRRNDGLLGRDEVVLEQVFEQPRDDGHGMHEHA
ncbi:hypothetical protein CAUPRSCDRAFT_13101 [Caulochytrium protostelioides]|uniref:Uncharacterized protein n=1 Tax=Caulochytrium protostelioides TaxID=1555241 RepID=A0A4V1ISY4_9FUNG|nr:hypothetical protein CAUPRSCDRAFT_13101 [Caulochytrium protostelioides]